MPLIRLTTVIHAPLARCFDLARSIELHQISTHGTNETAIAGVTSGLIDSDQMVVWRATHFGITQTLSSKITQFKWPHHFRDEMVEGAFKEIKHDHTFETTGNTTIMRDDFWFQSPGGILGKLINRMVLTWYMRRLLIKRNSVIKKVAESDDWKKILMSSSWNYRF